MPLHLRKQNTANRRVREDGRQFDALTSLEALK
jgi:hypothetical protein